MTSQRPSLSGIADETPLSDSSSVLTWDTIRDAMAKIGPAPRHRIIVGLPGVGANGVLVRETDGLIALGHAAFAALRKLALNNAHGSASQTIMGVRVETFDPTDASHRQILAELFQTARIPEPELMIYDR